MSYDLLLDDEAWDLVEKAAFNLAVSHAEIRHKRVCANVFDIDDSCKYGEPSPGLQCSNLERYPEDRAFFDDLFAEALSDADLKPHNLDSAEIGTQAIRSFLKGWYRGCQATTPTQSGVKKG